MAAPKKSKSEVEHELKISMTPRDLEKVFKALTKKLAVRKTVSHKYMPRAYYDTPDLKLYKNAISLRIQYKPGKGGVLGTYEQTVKFDLTPEQPIAHGTFLRKECKDPVPTHKPEIAKLSDREAKALLKPFKKKKMQHIFTAAIERRAFNLKVGRGKKAGVVEVAFDVGEIILACNDSRHAFSEVELEVVKGSHEAIYIIQKKIHALARSAGVQHLSKAQQGSRLHQKHCRRRKTASKRKKSK
ncbi:MAG: CYTH domain-containing protein [Alphaproteobacteria bacterium]|nr:CYTH domain-containing protein [Alphaproteobacteria bacterium]